MCLSRLLTSAGNKSEFENVLSSLVTMALDASDPVSSKLAFAFLAKSIIVWGTSPEAAAAPSVFAESAQITSGKPGANAIANGHANGAVAAQALPGFENFVYERLLPMCFEVPGKPEFKPKDGLYQLVSFIFEPRTPANSFRSCTKSRRCSGRRSRLVVKKASTTS